MVFSPPTVRPGLHTILLVQENDDLRPYFADVLMNAGFRVLQAANPGEAALFADDRWDEFDLVILDADDLDQAGIDVAVRLKQNCAGLKVVCLSLEDDAVMESYLLENLVDAFLVRPFHSSELVQTVERLLAGLSTAAVAARN